MAVAFVGPYAIVCTLLHHSIFTGQMLFVMPKQQCQSTEGKSMATTVTLNLADKGPICSSIPLVHWPSQQAVTSDAADGRSAPIHQIAPNEKKNKGPKYTKFGEASNGQTRKLTLPNFVIQQQKLW